MSTPRVFLSHQTACKYWAHHNSENAEKTRAVPAPSDTHYSVVLNDARYLVGHMNEDETLHAIVANDSKRHLIKHVSLHHHRNSFPDWSFRRIGHEVFVACPELCFLEAASFLPFDMLVLYGMELCGTYARLSEGDICYKCKALTSQRKIKSYLQKSPGAYGVRKAQSAARYLLNGSASPRESILAAIMTLPQRLGGFGMPAPLLNYGIEVNLPSKANFGKKQILHGDIVWRDARLIVEYDGAQHGIENNHISDKQRDHLMLEAGFDVVRFTDQSIRSGAELERLAKLINRRAHLHRKREYLQWSCKKQQTLDTLLFHSDPPWVCEYQAKAEP